MIDKKQVYVKSGKWCKHNICLSVAIMSAFPNLNGRELALLDYVISDTDRQKVTNQTDIDTPLSCMDVMALLNLKHKTTAQRILTKLRDSKLLVCVDKGKGTRCSYYHPNVELIRNKITKYLRRNKWFQEPNQIP